MKLVLVRHSKTIFEPDVPAEQWVLSADGVAKALELAGHPLLDHLDYVYSSSQTKALETALAITKPHRYKMRVDHRLTELTSITIKFIVDYDHDIHALYAGEVERLNGGESFTEGLERFTGCVEEIIARHPEAENIAIVSHANILSLFAEQYEPRTKLELHDSIAMPDIAVLDWGTKTFDVKFGESLV